MDFSLLLDQMSDITTKYIANKQNVSEIGFNIFTIVSDLYYRENFHSDIIQFFLDPDGEHGEKHLFLNLFLGLLPNVDKCNYKDATVKKEVDASYKGKKGRIDILIKDDTTRKAIIIENKIHDANNMSNQIPRYYYSLKSKGYDVEAIVYIPLDKFKNPYEGWENSDEKIKNLITIIPAYDYDSFNLVDNWIIPCCKANVASQEVKYVLQQYSKLIKFLYTDAMDTKALEDFYSVLRKENNMEIAVCINELCNQLPNYIMNKIYSKYQKKCAPFDEVAKEELKSRFIIDFYNAKIGDQTFNLAIERGDNITDKEYFWVYLHNVSEAKMKNTREFLKGLSFINDFKDLEPGSYSLVLTRFSILEEQKLCLFIDNLLTELKALNISYK